MLGHCTALTHLDLRGNEIGETGAESLAGVLGQCAALVHLNLDWLTSTSETMSLEQAGQRGLPECCGSAHRWLASISDPMALEQPGQRVYQECWGSAQRWLTSISTTMTLEQSARRA